jgi:hypothetical protein
VTGPLGPWEVSLTDHMGTSAQRPVGEGWEPFGCAYQPPAGGGTWGGHLWCFWRRRRLMEELDQEAKAALDDILIEVTLTDEASGVPEPIPEELE